MKKTFQNYSEKSIAVFFILLFFLFHAPVAAQETNPLFQIQTAFEEGKLSVDDAILQQINLIKNHAHTTPIKCATPLFLMYVNNADLLKEETKEAVSKAFPTTVSVASESYLSASGKFIVNYDTTGNNAVPLSDENNNFVPDYVEWIAEAADSSHEQLVGLGFTDFFTQKSMPYEIRVANSGAYGFTAFPNAPYISIENDFVGFPENDDPEGDQKGAVKVTVAHELKHVFQFVQNGWSGDPDRWLEMDATLYEEVVYDEVNDYYNYLNSFGNGNLFRSPTTTLIPGSYEDIVWALFFQERFGNTFWSEVWSRIESQAPSITYLEAISEALSEYDVSYEEAIIENMIWHFASGRDNSPLSFGFDERLLYPSPRLDETFLDLQLTLSEIETFSRFSGKYFEFDVLQQNPNQLRIDILPSSPDVQTGLIVYYEDLSIETLLITNPLANQISFEETDFSWSEIDRLGLVFFNTSTQSSNSVQFQVYDYVSTDISSPELSQNYPNPFNPNTIISVSLPFSQQIKLTVYDYLGREVQVLEEGRLPSGITPISFNATGLASGIYFYRLETEEGVITKKMTFIK
ncbi:MAG: T9SS type A sorting domain-containing protein [Balneolaceae bacterium]